MRPSPCYSQHDVTDLLRRATIMQAVIALQQIQTITGAMRVYVAEHQGLRRARILTAADRRIAQLRHEEGAWVPKLEIAGQAIGPDQIAWEQRRRLEG